MSAVGRALVFHVEQTICEVGLDVIERVARLNEQVTFEFEALRRSDLNERAADCRNG